MIAVVVDNPVEVCDREYRDEDGILVETMG